ncbi:hypothetical protein PRZ48_004907 [Zasmidium cellare]|uniref:Heterokaryon incompatibility domain-containing protein n=1 Tax=Zasmidium cellare TaxID=395010 RepID=A0ABR0ER87_ZASCE|nr:hypothetical protein PRZ48_004907 [Zasmidium cellare]
MDDESCDDSQSTCSDLTDDESLLDFFSGEPVHSQDAQEDEGNLNSRPSQYQPLEDHEIRLIVLDLANIFDDAIHCRFQKTSIRWPIAYSALSYAWGRLYEDGSHFTHTITCNELPFKVTTTLCQALLRIRHLKEDAVAYLWIDAICINQSDPVERAAQVSIMDKVYSSASHLFVWLGEDIIPPQFGPDPDPQRVDEVAQDHHLNDVSSYNANLREAPWFARRWVIQEVLSCRKSQFILAGPMQFEVANLSNVLIDPSMTLAQGTTSSSKVHRRRTLFENLITFDKALCSDDRDRVYALRNISEDGDLVMINYSQSFEDLYTSLARQWINAGCLAQVLIASAGSRSTGRARANQLLPSWVPDWSREIAGSHKSDLKALRLPSLGVPGLADPGVSYVNEDSGLRLQVVGWVIPRDVRPCEEQKTQMDLSTGSSLEESFLTPVERSKRFKPRVIGRRSSKPRPGSPTHLQSMYAELHLLMQLDIDVPGTEDREVMEHDAVLLTEAGDAFGLRRVDGSGHSDQTQDVWALLGTHKRVWLAEGSGRSHSHGGYWYYIDQFSEFSDTLLPDQQQVSLA